MFLLSNRVNPALCVFVVVLLINKLFQEQFYVHSKVEWKILISHRRLSSPHTHNLLTFNVQHGGGTFVTNDEPDISSSTKVHSSHGGSLFVLYIL